MRFRDDRDPAFGDKLAAKKPVLVAVDLGAESCRVSLLRWIEGQPEILSRAPLRQFRPKRGKRSPLGHCCHPVRASKRACAPARNLRPKESPRLGWTVGPWTMYAWAQTDNPSPILFVIATNVRVAGAKQVHSRISPERLYELTGVQILALNTLYQLRADVDAEQNLPWINLPEFLLHRLGGSEFPNTPMRPIPSSWVCRTMPGVLKFSRPPDWM